MNKENISQPDNGDGQTIMMMRMMKMMVNMRMMKDEDDDHGNSYADDIK